MTDTTTTEEIRAGMAAAVRAATDAMRETRDELLGKLRAAGFTQIEATYDGYGDSGDVNEITDGMERDLERDVSSFVWDFAYSRHPGFENNQGGQGVLTWDIAADKITLDHGDNYVEIDYTFEEDL